MDSPIIYLIAIGVALLIGYKLYGYYEYFTMPNLKSYLKDNPNCNTGHGIKCNNCGSKSIKNWGITHTNSFFRAHICNHCGIWLYRS